MLVAMAVRGNAVVDGVIGGLQVCRGIIHNPVRMHLLPHRIVWPQCVMVHPILVKRTLHFAPCIAECHHTNKGVQCQAWDDAGKACHSREFGKIQWADMCGLHLVAIGQAWDDGFNGKLYVRDGGAGGEDNARCTGV
jgi:hypothetical protein